MASRFLGMRWWLAAAFAAVAAVTAFAVVAELNARSIDAFKHYAQDLAIGVTVSTAESLKHARTIPELRRAAAEESMQRRIGIFVFDGNGRLLTASTSNGTPWSKVPSGATAPESVIKGARYIHGASDGSAFVLGVRIHGGPGHVLVTYVLRPELRTQLGIVRNEFPGAAIIAFVVGAAIGLSIAVLIGRRLSRLAAAANAIGEGNLAVPVADRFPDEVGSLAQSIETMRRQLEQSFHTLREDRERLEAQERAQREFATNAAHELRTPLASIVTAVEMLQTGAKHEPAERDEFLQLIEQEAARLTRLTQALLVLARAEAHEEAPHLTHFKVRSILEHVAASLRPPDGVDVVVDCDPALEAEGAPDLLEQAIASLATNSVQHTSAGSVRLSAAASNGDVVIAVADSGSGIPADRQSKIFERFYRAENGRGGFGLGLAIARDAVRVLGGSIDVSSTEGVGTTVSVRIPSVHS